MDMAKKGDKYVCGLCGVELECVEGCGCYETDIICCGKPMKKTAKKKAAKAKKKR
jgi:hypothetical protein